MVRVVVIGGGVNGIGSGLRIIQKYPSFKVTIVAKCFSPNTTGDGAAGLWTPYLSEKTPPEKMAQWGTETHKLFYSLWLEGKGGVTLVPVVRMKEGDPYELPLWSTATYGFRVMKEEELRFWSKAHSASYTSGLSYVTHTCEPAALLPLLMERFVNAGGEFVNDEINSLEEIASEGYDVIINCTGLGARYLVPDEKVHPIRGQITRVNAPWICHAILDESDNGNYIIPNISAVVLGGTSQKHNYNTRVDSGDAEFIMSSCAKMVGAVREAPLIRHWVGLRPGRESVRLEREDIFNERGRRVVVIHNYGHGGCGVTLFWGCAAEVVRILDGAFQHLNPLNSRL